MSRLESPSDFELNHSSSVPKTIALSKSQLEISQYLHFLFYSHIPQARGAPMATDSAIDWALGERSGLVSIENHRLALYASGPARKPGDPVVIIVQGLACSRMGWAAVVCLLESSIRVYHYDRTGYGHSDPSPGKPTATEIAAELDLLLKNAEIPPPYVVVAHSWGGVLSREFLARRPDDVVGMVFVDANQERTLEVLDWRNPSIWAVAKGLDNLGVMGVRRNRKLTDEEWRAYEEDENGPKHKAQAELEKAEYAASFPVLALKHQLHRDPPLLGDRPVCVVMGRNECDYEKLYEAGVEAGHGTEEERAAFREILRTWVEKDRMLQSETLTLSGRSQLIVAGKSGHDVQLTQPEVIVDGVQWVLNQLRE